MVLLCPKGGAGSRSGQCQRLSWPMAAKRGRFCLYSHRQRAALARQGAVACAHYGGWRGWVWCWGLGGLVLGLGVVGMLVKKQLSAMQTTPGTVQESSRQVQQHIQQQVEGLMQQARPMPEDQPQDDKN